MLRGRFAQWREAWNESAKIIHLVNHSPGKHVIREGWKPIYPTFMLLMCSQKPSATVSWQCCIWFGLGRRYIWFCPICHVAAGLQRTNLQSSNKITVQRGRISHPQKMIEEQKKAEAWFLAVRLDLLTMRLTDGQPGDCLNETFTWLSWQISEPKSCPAVGYNPDTSFNWTLGWRLFIHPGIHRALQACESLGRTIL